MPIYLYQNPETLKVKEIIQKMSDPHTYSEDGVEWVRIFTSPNAGVDTKVDVNDPMAFLRATNKKMTIGDMWDESGRMSEQRIQKDGYDHVKEKALKKYKKRCKGKEHPLRHGNGAKGIEAML